MRRSRIVVLAAAVLPVLAGCAAGGGGLTGEARLFSLIPQEAERPSHLQELFTSERPLVFTLAADFDQLGRDRSQESEQRPARLLLPGPGGDTLDLPLRIRTRGNFRLQRNICSFPPLRLNFAKDSVKGTVLAGEDRLKLVTHCRAQTFYEQNLVEELLAYRIYNLLTDISFRVQLAFITYVDTSGKSGPVSRLAFLIEDEDLMAERLGGQMVWAPAAPPGAFQPQHAAIMYLFQYMIGNTDWSMVSFHNMRVMRIEADYFPVPYDFDFAGLVSAPYAGPNPALAHLHSSVRERLYRGFCSDGIDYDALFAFFNDRREAILDLVRNQPGLSAGNTSSAARYIEDFFWEINDPGTARTKIVQACRRAG